jgi:hypothetical protein
VTLFATPHRKAFLRAVDQPGRVYMEDRIAWDRSSAGHVTARLKEAFSAGWIEPIPPGEVRAAGIVPMPGRVFYRLTAAGAVHIRQSGDQR